MVAVNNFDDKRVALIEYLRMKTNEGDWHAVSDAANDLRVLEAEDESYSLGVDEAMQDAYIMAEEAFDEGHEQGFTDGVESVQDEEMELELNAALDKLLGEWGGA